MAADYDAPRTTSEEEPADPLEELRAQRTTPQAPVIDVGEDGTAEGIDLPRAGLSGEELHVRVIPVRADEFTCGSCCLVHHRSQKAREKDGTTYCRDCEG
jgi:hypothetical protein